MVSATRSGKIHKAEDKSNTNGHGIAKGTNSSATLTSTTTSVSKSKGTSGEVVEDKYPKVGGSQPDNKKHAENSIRRRSLRLEKLSPVLPVKVTSKQVAKTTSSPRRGSERIGNLVCSHSKLQSSRGSNKTNKKKKSAEGALLGEKGATPDNEKDITYKNSRKRSVSKSDRAASTPENKKTKVANITRKDKDGDNISDGAGCSLGRNNSNSTNRNVTSSEEAFSEATSFSARKRSKSVESCGIHHEKRAHYCLQAQEICTLNPRQNPTSSSRIEEDNPDSKSEDKEGDQSSTKRETVTSIVDSPSIVHIALDKETVNLDTEGLCVEDGVVDCDTRGKEEEQSSSKRQTLDVTLCRETAIIVADTSYADCETLDREEDRGKNENTERVCFNGVETTELDKPEQCCLPGLAYEVCIICKHPGTLLQCDGKNCKRRYHMFCIDPPLEKAPPGTWHCTCCVRKKRVSGVHSVSEGIESLCYATVPFSSRAGTKIKKQYLAKFTGLAHVHNRLISEDQLLSEAPNLVAEFNKLFDEKKVILWNREWCVPQRFIQKRLVMPSSLEDECISRSESDSSIGFSTCYYEWFVKWTGLGYEHATWEFEDSNFMKTPEAKKLAEYYERRHEEAKSACDPSTIEKVLSIKRNPLHGLLKLPGGSPFASDTSLLCIVNKLREYWHKAESFVLSHDPELQERICAALSKGRFPLHRRRPRENIVKVVLFISALISDILKPILIIAAPDSIQSWESEFLRLSPSVDVVVYEGTSETRKLIQALEFYEECGCIMFKVLMSHPDAIIGDSEMLKSIGWEAIIVDDCQLPRMSKHLEQFKALSADLRILLFNGQVKDIKMEHSNLLSFLDSKEEQKSSKPLQDSSSSLDALQEKFQRYCTNIPVYSKFLEFWVPVKLSTIQLEEYCVKLCSSYGILCAGPKADHVGGSCDILMSTRKCCDHPYLVDDSLQASLIKDHPPNEYLDIGVDASAKLMLLDKVLYDMKNRGQRAVILFQVIVGDIKISMGDILDDFLRQRFGVESYERVESGLSVKKKQASLRMFNDIEKGRFVFLIENRACVPGIKLASVDAVIIFGSDWNPLNDLNALQKISIESKSERLKIFRLYSLHTVEEKILSLAKRDVFPSRNITNMNRSIYYSLLNWGASLLFDELDDFHKNDASTSLGTSSQKSILDDTAAEISNELSGTCIMTDTNVHSIISVAAYHGSGYSRNNFLVGEKSVQNSDEIPSQVFWSKLLDKRDPPWRYLTGVSHRGRRKVQNFTKRPHVRGVNDEAKNKRKKTFVGTEDSVSCPPPACDKKKKVCVANENLDHSSKECGTPKVEIGGQGVCNSQKNLRILLRPELAELCDALRLPNNVKLEANGFLEYIVKNHQVIHEPKSLVQAFKMSLCWMAASFSNYKVDHTESLAVAKKCLRFECSEREAELVYSKLQLLRERYFSTKTSICMGSNVSAIRSPEGRQNKESHLDGQAASDLPDFKDVNIQDVCRRLKQPSRSSHSTDTSRPQPSCTECRQDTSERIAHSPQMGTVPVHLQPEVSLPVRLEISPSTLLPVSGLGQIDAPAVLENEQAFPSGARCPEDETEVIREKSMELVSEPVGAPNQYCLQTSESQEDFQTVVQVERVNNLGCCSTSQEPVSNLTRPSPVTTRLPQGLHCDPLKNELTRLSTEAVLITQQFEGKKSQLRHEFESDIEKLAMKYSVLLQDAEADFLEKRNKLDITHKMVSMNLSLADLFRSKFIRDIPVVEKADRSQGHLVLGQPSLVTRPQAFQGAVSSSLMTVNPVMSTSPSLPLTLAANTLATQKTVSVFIQASVPAVQVVRRASELFSSDPDRSSIRPMPPYNGNHQANGILRCPAPHLQSFRTCTSINTSNLMAQSHNVPHSVVHANLQTPATTQSIPSRDAGSRMHHYPGGHSFPSIPVSLQIPEAIVSVPSENSIYTTR